MQVKRSDIPLYLQTGEFFQSLEYDSDTFITIPERTIKSNPTVHSHDELIHLLCSMRFWIVDTEDLAFKILDYVFSCVDLQVDLDEFIPIFPYLATALTVARKKPDVQMEISVQRGDIRVVKYLESKGQTFADSHALAAARSGQLIVLQYIHSKKRLPTSTMKIAARCGHVDCLRFLVELGHKVDYAIPLAAAEGGHVECLQLLHQLGQCPWNTVICAAAARNGHLKCLKFAHEHGCEWTYMTCVNAAQCNRLECLEYAHTHGCEWNAATTSVAANHGHLACLQYAHEHGCPWEAFICSQLAERGQIEILRYAHLVVGQECTVMTMRKAAIKGQLQSVKCLHEMGCPWDESVCQMAALTGRLEILRYCHTHGCPWDADTCTAAALGGSLECLQYAHEQGCPWEARTVAMAVAGGSHPCLRYCVEQGCPFDDTALWYARDRGKSGEAALSLLLSQRNSLEEIGHALRV